MSERERLLSELNTTRTALGLSPVQMPGTGYCHANRDGECDASECPQLRDNEPARSGRHCPIDIHDDEY